MAGTRTAPVVTGAVSSGVATLHLIDASGDQWSDSITTVALPTAIDIEAWAVAYQAASQASLWKVSQTWNWAGAMDTSNATNNQRSSGAQGINNLYRNPTTLVSETPRLIAPIEAVMQGNQDIPLLSSAEMIALILAELGILVGFNHESSQFTGRRERRNNPRITT